MNKAVAFANNQVVFLAWAYGKKIPRCLGFSVHRIDTKLKAEMTLPAWVGFEGDNNRDWTAKTTDEWPVQKFNWRDFTAKSGGTYQYRIVPRIGAPNQLKDAPAGQQLTTNTVTVAPQHGNVAAYFNQGILSTQSVTHLLPNDPSGAPSSAELMKRIAEPGNDLRKRLAGQMIDALLTLLERAKSKGGACYCALYELSDVELLDALRHGGRHVHLILSNTGPDDSENAPNRQPLRDAGVDLIDRMMKTGHIGHNKFVVYVDGQNHPQAVLTGSTNWTPTALCAQSNNAIIVEDPQLAAAYLNYWHRLKDDTKGRQAEQSPAFRHANDQAFRVTSSSADIWYSPNTPQATKPTTNAATPHDMQMVFAAIGAAKQAILFLVFQPGDPSILEPIADAQKKNPDLIVRGAATDPRAVDRYDTLLFHRTPGQTDTVRDTTVVAAAAIQDEFAYWHKELLKSSPSAHAIIHDKIVVIDPLSDQCVVITGSHNLGFRASYANDENLLIMRGNRDVAAAYLAHVMDVYDHYRWRFWLQTQKDRSWKGLKRTDVWQKSYFDSHGFASHEILYWTGEDAPARTATAPKQSRRRSTARRRKK